MIELYLHPTICLHGVVLNKFSTGTTLPLPLPLPGQGHHTSHKSLTGSGGMMEALKKLKENAVPVPHGLPEILYDVIGDENRSSSDCYLLCSSAPETQAIGSFETSVNLYQIMQYHTAERTSNPTMY
jgi:hypothetical protein